jgi:hypothetical protein
LIDYSINALCEQEMEGGSGVLTENRVVDDGPIKYRQSSGLKQKQLTLDKGDGLVSHCLSSAWRTRATEPGGLAV